MIKKKVKTPIKEQNNIPLSGHRNSTTYYKNDIYSKNDKTGKIDIWIKNHGKCNQINQIALDLLNG